MIVTYLGGAIPQLRVGSLRWSGNDFTAVSMTGRKLSSTLKTANGLPTELLVNSRNGDRPNLLCNYAFSDSKLPLCYPSKIVLCRLTGTTQKPIREIRVAGLKTASAPFPSSEYEPAQFIIPDHRHDVALSNSVYYKTVNGQMRTRNPASSGSALPASGAQQGLRMS
jgi:hypothetical protein